MIASEAAKLLMGISSFDGREVTTDGARAWALALADVDYSEASAWLIEHFREHSSLGYQKVMPADVIAGIAARRRRVVSEAGRAAYFAVLDGTPMAEASPELRARAIAAAKAAEHAAGRDRLELEAPERPRW